MKQASEGMGLVKGPIAALSGEYFGLNGTGAQFKADMDLIRTQAPLIMGSGYKAAVESFMTGIGSTNNAPSFLKLQASQMQTAMRNRAQEMADAETTSHQGKLPPSLANGLISQGVVPNGYQDQRTLDQLPAGQAALWKARFAPTALNAEDRATLFTDAANGKFGPIAQPGEDLKNILQIHQTYKAQQAAKTQQGTASAAAVSANAPAQVAPVVSGQPAETPEAGAQQPQQPAQQGQAQPPADQQQPEQQGNQPQAQGQQPPQDATQQNAQVQDATQLAPGGALMPPTAVPGQPATLVPGTNGATPLPQPNPLPQISQTLTPQGGVPTPASQAPVQNTTQPDLQGQVDAELDKVNRERTPGGLMSNNPQMGSQEGQRVPLPAPPVPPQAPPPAPSPYTPIFGGM
jgi:hypothetical protein